MKILCIRQTRTGIVTLTSGPDEFELAATDSINVLMNVPYVDPFAQIDNDKFNMTSSNGDYECFPTSDDLVVDAVDPGDATLITIATPATVAAPLVHLFQIEGSIGTLDFVYATPRDMWFENWAHASTQLDVESFREKGGVFAKVTTLDQIRAAFVASPLVRSCYVVHLAAFNTSLVAVETVGTDGFNMNLGMLMNEAQTMYVATEADAWARLAAEATFTSDHVSSIDPLAASFALEGDTEGGGSPEVVTTTEVQSELPRMIGYGIVGALVSRAIG